MICLASDYDKIKLPQMRYIIASSRQMTDRYGIMIVVDVPLQLLLEMKEIPIVDRVRSRLVSW